jgi:diguanylate cyclase (GGDEF)-like protein
MQRIKNFNRALAALILVVVAGVTIYGYTALVTSAMLTSTAAESYSWSARYRNLESLVDSQVDAATWSAAAAARKRVEAELYSFQRIARDPENLAAISIVERAERQRSYRGISDFIASVARHRLLQGEGLYQRLEAVERSLEWSMIGIGLLGLGIAELATQMELRRLRRAVRSDGLTSLGNHRAFRDDLAGEIARSRRHGHAMTLALIDLDDFKTLNDACGHIRGDEVLVQTARALASGRTEDRVYRIGGDEFAIIFPETPGIQARPALERMRDDLKHQPGSATLSMGLCELQGEFSEHDLCERADAALYAAKKSGRDVVVDFESIREDTTIFSVEKMASLQVLLEDRMLSVAFQPIWDMVGRRILGFEALARPAAELGFAGPQEAFDVAERHRRVAELDQLCIEKILDVASRVPAGYLVFINITPQTLIRAEFEAEHLRRAVEAVGLEPRQIVLEVTERRIADVRELVRGIRELRQRGFLLALDDTGSGHAGLEILSKVTLDFVKVDRCVVTQASVNRRARGVLAGIAAIAREGETVVIAEGVESIEQLSFLHSLRGADVQYGQISGVQGYLLGEPRSCRPDPSEFFDRSHVFDRHDGFKRRPPTVETLETLSCTPVAQPG